MPRSGWSNRRPIVYFPFLNQPSSTLLSLLAPGVLRTSLVFVLTPSDTPLPRGCDADNVGDAVRVNNPDTFMIPYSALGLFGFGAFEMLLATFFRRVSLSSESPSFFVQSNPPSGRQESPTPPPCLHPLPLHKLETPLCCESFCTVLRIYGPPRPFWDLFTPFPLQELFRAPAASDDP